MKKTIFLILVAVVLVGAGVAYLQYHKPHRNTSAETAAYALTASALFQEYEADEAAANAQYLDKLLLVEGTLSAITEAEDGTTSISLHTEDPMFGVSCQLLPDEAEKLSGLADGEQIQVKGICTGKLMDVVLVRGVIE